MRHAFPWSVLAGLSTAVLFAIAGCPGGGDVAGLNLRDSGDSEASLVEAGDPGAGGTASLTAPTSPDGLVAATPSNSSNPGNPANPANPAGPQPPSQLGATDLNGDGTLDDTDVTLMINRFGLHGSAGDLSGDGMVDLWDLAILLREMGIAHGQ